MTASVLVGVNCVLAGVTLFAGIACLGIWLFDRSSRAFAWMTALATAVTVQLIAGSVIVSGPEPSDLIAVTFVRSVASMAAAIISVHAAGLLVPRLPTRRIVQALLAVAVFRAALWWPTDLIVRHPLTPDRRVSFGPFGWTWIPFVLGLVLTGAFAVARTSGTVRWLTAVGVLAYVAVWIVPLFVADDLAFEELVTLNVLPGGVAILALAARVVLRGARDREHLLRRQKLITQLSRASVDASVDDLRRMAERQMRDELNAPDLVIAVFDRDRATRYTEPRFASSVAEGRRRLAVVSGVGPLDRASGDYVHTMLRIVASSADRASADAEFAHRAVHDDLTGLPNLVLLRSRLDACLTGESVPDVLLMLCRVGRLGRTVATEGLDRSDSLLAAMARALEQLRRPGTTVARMSTDTFAVVDLLPHDDPDGFLVGRLRQVHGAAQEAAGDVVEVGAVVGRPGSTAESMVRDALTAVERSRAAGRTVIFDEGLAAHLRARVDLERDLEHALERNQIEVRYQPVVDPKTRAVLSCEALARWRRGDEVMPAAEWIPLAERTGLIHRIGRHVLSVAASEQHRLGVPVAVNVSPLELAEDNFVADVVESLGDCPPALVTLELTESAMMSDLDRSITVLEELRALGMGVALDDFGSSYSSLGALADLPVDVLKLDRSFVARLETPGGLAVVAAIITLGHALGKPIVAEGVETEAQLTLLIGLGVDRVQGFLLGRPVTADRVGSGRARPVPRYSSSVR